jgi:hypothetical protein
VTVEEAPTVCVVGLAEIVAEPMEGVASPVAVPLSAMLWVAGLRFMLVS